MSIWKQLVLCLIVAVIAGFVVLKQSPKAASFAADHGMAPALTALGIGPPSVTGPESASGSVGTTGPGTTSSGLTGASKTAAPARTGAGPARKATVVLQPAGTAIINDRITALGTGTALQSVTVLPKASGTLTEILVQSGQAVTKGQILARLDSNVQQIARDKAQLTLQDAQRTLERNKVLVQSKAAPVNQTQAVELAAQMAELSLRQAEQDLADRVVIAPISGVAGIVKVNAGNDVTSDTAIVTIENASSLLVNFWLPERLAGQVKLGAEATLLPVAQPDRTLKAKVSSIDNQIDPASGTFQVQAQVDNADASLQAGMAFTVALQFAGQAFVTVDPLAVQWDSDGAFVWRYADATVEKLPVRIVQRNTETVLVAGEIKAGDSIVTEGLDGLKPGAEVQVFGADAAPDGAAGTVAKPGNAPAAGN